MNHEKDVPQSDYSVDEILAEAHVMEGRGEAENQAAETNDAQPGAKPAGADEIARRAKEALERSAGEEISPEKPERTKKKKQFSLFHRKNRKKMDMDENPEDDIYYGLQLKPLEEYRREYESTVRRESGSGKNRDGAPKESGDEKAEKTPEKAQPGEPASDSSFPYLFEDREDGEDPEFTETIEKIRRGRQERLEKIMQHAGLDSEDVFDGEEDIFAPEPPGRPPRHDVPPIKEPPSPPAVQPGPVREPEVRPPLAQPPEKSAAPEVPPPDPTKSEATSSGDSGPDRPEQKEQTVPAGTSVETERAETIPDAPAGAVKEPAAIPEPVKEEGTPPPSEKEPQTRPAPPYRAVNPPLHIVELNGIEDAMAAEAAVYAPPEPPKPETIPFRTANEEKAEPALERPTAEPPSEKDESIPLPVQESGQTGVPKRKKGFRLFGNDEDTTPLAEDPLKGEDELDDYQSPADAPSVLNDLAAKVRGLTLRTLVTALCMVILLGFSIAWEYPVVFPPGLHNSYGEQAFLFIHLIFLLIACVFCILPLGNGFRGLFTFQANSDSAAAVAAAAAVAQNITYLITGLPDGLHLYSALAAAALFLNTVGKLSMMRRILRNFRFVSSDSQKYAVQMFGDYNTALRLSQGTQIEKPQIACQTKTGFLRNFLRFSYAPDPSDHTSQILAPVGFIASLALCIVAAVLSKNAVTALTAFTAAACMCVPFANTLSVNLPLARLGKIAARNGAMAAGWPAVEEFSQTNAVLLDAKDLFPRGTVVLNGIQTFQGQKIDEAILDATALSAIAGGTLDDLFSQIIKSRNETPPHVIRPAYEDGMGISGTVNDHVILVGNRKLLEKHGVNVPPRDYEEKYVRAGKMPVYLASGGLLVAMFLVSYRSDRRRAMELRRLEYNGISLIIRTRDPNITPAFLSGCFGLSGNFIVVLPEKLGNIYSELQSSPPERAPALMATKGRATAMARLLAACVRQRGNISIAIALQTAGAILGLALTAFFTFYAGLQQLSVIALTLFEAFWTAAVLLAPRLRRP